LITSQEIKVRRYIIERDIPHVGDCSFVQLRQAARTSNAALAALGPDIQWVESYAANDRMFCVYLAKNEMIILNHADISGFPVSKITEVKQVIDPETASV